MWDKTEHCYDARYEAPQRPGIFVNVPLRSRVCKCGVPFETRSPNCTRCPACRKLRDAKVRAKNGAKRQVKRRAASAERRAAKSS